MPTNFGVKETFGTETRKAADYRGHVAIDMNTYLIKGVGDYRILSVRTWLENPKAPIYLMPITRTAGYADFGEFELRALYKNALGSPFTGFGRPALEKALIEHIASLPPQPPLTPEEDALADKHTEALFPTRNWGPHDDVAVRYKAPTATGEPRKRGPAQPGGRPSTGTATGRVWDIADAVYARHSAAGAIDWKALRADILKEGTAAGINPATVQVQYGKWKGSKTSS